MKALRRRAAYDLSPSDHQDLVDSAAETTTFQPCRFKRHCSEVNALMTVSLPIRPGRCRADKDPRRLSAYSARLLYLKSEPPI